MSKVSLCFKHWSAWCWEQVIIIIISICFLIFLISSNRKSSIIRYATSIEVILRTVIVVSETWVHRRLSAYKWVVLIAWSLLKWVAILVWSSILIVSEWICAETWWGIIVLVLKIIIWCITVPIILSVSWVIKRLRSFVESIASLAHTSSCVILERITTRGIVISPTVIKGKSASFILGLLHIVAIWAKTTCKRVCFWSCTIIAIEIVVAIHLKLIIVVILVRLEWKRWFVSIQITLSEGTHKLVLESCCRCVHTRIGWFFNFHSWIITGIAWGCIIWPKVWVKLELWCPICWCLNSCDRCDSCGAYICFNKWIIWGCTRLMEGIWWSRLNWIKLGSSWYRCWGNTLCRIC